MNYHFGWYETIPTNVRAQMRYLNFREHGYMREALKMAVSDPSRCLFGWVSRDAPQYLVSWCVIYFDDVHGTRLNVYTRNDFRGHGYGGTLVKKMLDRVKPMKLRVRVNTCEANAEAFWDKITKDGYKLVKESCWE